MGVERYDDDDHIVLIDRENKITLVKDIAVPLTHNLPKTEAENIMKCKNMALEIKNIWKLNNVSLYLLFISLEGTVARHFLTYLENIDLSFSVQNLKSVVVPRVQSFSATTL